MGSRFIDIVLSSALANLSGFLSVLFAMSLISIGNVPSSPQDTGLSPVYIISIAISIAALVAYYMDTHARWFVAGIGYVVFWFVVILVFAMTRADTYTQESMVTVLEKTLILGSLSFGAGISIVVYVLARYFDKRHA